MAGQKFSKSNIIRDREIDLYCQSVEKLLSNISEKSGSKSRMQTFTDEFEFMDHDEDMLEY